MLNKINNDKVFLVYWEFIKDILNLIFFKNEIINIINYFNI